MEMVHITFQLQFGYILPSSITVQRFTAINWQEKKLSIQNVQSSSF